MPRSLRASPRLVTEEWTLPRGGAAHADTVLIAVTGIHGNFYSNPFFNHRTDCYAGAAILPAILSAMRATTSPNFLITMKINSTDEYPGGLDQNRFLEACHLMQGLDAIEVSANGTSRRGIRAGVNEGPFLPADARLASEVDTPVVLVGGLRSVEYINHVLADTSIAYIGLSRPLVCEPNLVLRWQ